MEAFGDRLRSDTKRLDAMQRVFSANAGIVLDAQRGEICASRLALTAPAPWCSDTPFVISTPDDRVQLAKSRPQRPGRNV